MKAMVSPFFIVGTPQIYMITPSAGAVASKITLPKKSVT